MIGLISRRDVWDVLPSVGHLRWCPALVETLRGSWVIAVDPAPVSGNSHLVPILTAASSATTATTAITLSATLHWILHHGVAL